MLRPRLKTGKAVFLVAAQQLAAARRNNRSILPLTQA